ncbi:hypothetical protein HOLleu_10954 [Holothuria leucospilota]|uniref:Uncharacterized protein n=1 Tax=Holothuria leucospilota TaxID=206669 RepID=A0A9Q1CFV5_HOLLE|nr:hypothetical protein HOLleu_10954 [Holothuria leucospilota]
MHKVGECAPCVWQCGFCGPPVGVVFKSWLIASRLQHLGGQPGLRLLYGLVTPASNTSVRGILTFVFFGLHKAGLMERPVPILVFRGEGRPADVLLASGVDRDLSSGWEADFVRFARDDVRQACGGPLVSGNGRAG